MIIGVWVIIIRTIVVTILVTVRVVIHFYPHNYFIGHYVSYLPYYEDYSLSLFGLKKCVLFYCRWLQDHARKGQYDVAIENVTDDMSCLGIAGPHSRSVMTKLTSTDMTNDQFKFLTFKDIDLAGIPVRAMRISYTGELGWELYHKNEHTAELYEALLKAGEEFNIGDFGTYALSSLRIEKAFRAWGQEMNMDTTPLEAGLDYFIRFDKGVDFIGREALLKHKENGIQKKVCMLIVDTNDVDPEGNETIWFGGKVVGNTTSGSYSYRLKKSIALAYLPLELSELGSRVEVELLGTKCPATVVKDPLFETEPTRTRRQEKAAQKANLNRERTNLKAQV